jgi:hypothetical protein
MTECGGFFLKMYYNKMAKKTEINQTTEISRAFSNNLIVAPSEVRI